MRRALFGILMTATAAMPIAAQAQDPDRTEGMTERAATRAERNAEHYREQGERNQARSERRELRQEVRQERQETRQEVRVQRQEQVAPVQQHQAQSWGRRGGGDGQRAQHWGGGRIDSDREAYRQRVEETRAANRQSIDESVGGNYAREGLRNQQRVERGLRQEYRGERDHHGGSRNWNGSGRPGDHRELHRDYRSDHRNLHRSDPTRGEHRRFHRQTARDHNGYHRDWDRGWRNDSRYNWQRYRYSNRNLFRSGGYYAPYRNYRYNRLSIGIVLDSLFYSNRYWLSDPYQYRLPHAPYGTQWVRYYDDVVLVDVYTGEVLDVIENFFW